MAGVHTARKQGAMVTAQIAGRPVGVMLGVDTNLNPFSIRPSWQDLLKLPPEQRLVRMQDPAFRAKLLSEEHSPELLKRLSQFRQYITTSWDRMFPMGDPPNYEPHPDESIGAMSKRSNRTPEEIAYDYLAGGADKFLYFPIVGYNGGNHEVIRAMLSDETTILGLSDGGAHCSSIVDASVPSWMLIHWARDRTRGAKFSVENLVRRQTSETARFFGFKDRGVLEAGMKADLNVFDFDGLRLHAPEVAYDLPKGGRRLLQRVDGYHHTFVSGIETWQNGAHTGALPGRLVRAGR
jgi:N-acyl-D-aspartate/D-glutamate deacylase